MRGWAGDARRVGILEVQCIAGDPNTPSEVIREIAKRGFFGARLCLAHDPNTLDGALRLLAKDDVSNVRKAVASNPNAPDDVLVGLARDPDPEVVEAVARNPTTPIELLSVWARDPTAPQAARLATAENPSTPLPYLRALLAAHVPGRFETLARLARNTAAPPDVLEAIFSATQHLYESSASLPLAGNRASPPSLLRRIAQMTCTPERVRNWSARPFMAAFAANPSTPSALLRELLQVASGSRPQGIA